VTLPDIEHEIGLTWFVFGPGTGESIAIRVADGEQEPRWLVVDSCVVEPGGVAPAERIIDYYAEDLTYLLITHRHEDHVLGAPYLLDLLAASPHKEKSLIVADDHADRSSALRRGSDSKTDAVSRGIDQALLALDEASKRGIPRIVAHAGMAEQLPLGEATLQVLAPPRPPDHPVPARDANLWSIVSWLDWRDTRLLLGADAPARVFRDLAPPPALQQHTACKVPHHGSRGSLHDAWTGGTDRGRDWNVTPYSTSSLPRVGAASEPPSPSLLDHVDQLRLTSLPVRDTFRLTVPGDVTADEYARAVADRKRGTESLRAAPDAARTWSDAMWWCHVPASGAPLLRDRGASTVLIGE
jgi:glyoxylase-like metal-dependent hydrolase (beta-lactamase superfamily II)